jgi:hypothetical protein
MARNANNDKVQGGRLHLDQFTEMLKVTLHINPSANIIRTKHGDLVGDPEYQGRMYLRGLLLPGGGVSGKPYAYGYNFVDGTTTRDRDALTVPGEESSKINPVWATVIRENESEDSGLLREYTELLLQSLNKKADVILDSDSNCFDKDIAQKVWAIMLTMNGGEHGQTAFYHSAIEGKDVSKV